MPDDLAVFSYLTAEKADSYRRVMAAFLAAKQGFVLHLRPQDVLDAMAADHDPPADLDAVRTLLAQLLEWGNLRADPDTADVTTVEDFYRARFLYQLTVAGEAAERAVAHFEELLVTPGELQTAALSDIRELLSELLVLARSDDADAGKVHRCLATLSTRFEELTDRARTFITGLQRTVDLHGIDLDAFVAYKDRLIEYLERFIGDLLVAQGRIAGLVAEIEAAGADRMLDLAAERDLVDRLDPTEDDRREARRRWGQRWDGLCSWFVAPGTRPTQGGATPADPRPAQADVLRARARQAIPALLQAVSQINERRVSRTDRPADLRALARWFAECPTDADAHRLWRAAFGLAPSRHLKVDADTLDDRADHPVPAATSWLDAPPLQVSPQLRRTGHYVRRGRPSSVIDRSAEKALLARQANDEAAQLDAARARLATDGQVRLSDLRDLDPDAFALFLDLLGAALSIATDGEVVRTSSADGGLEVVLTPTDDGRVATITTTWGSLAGPDHLVEIVDLVGAAPGDSAGDARDGAAHGAADRGPGDPDRDASPNGHAAAGPSAPHGPPTSVAAGREVGV